MRRHAAAGPLAVMLLAAGCARHTAPAAPMHDSTLEQAANSGRQALSSGHASQAVSQYRNAFTRALARNDAPAIGDCGYDLAVAQLADGNPAAALATIRRTRDALAARAAPGFAELDLAQAAALHRLGDDPPADRLAAHAQATAGDPATVERASYIRGLIAYARGDQAGIVSALDGFGQPGQAGDYSRMGSLWQADHDELAARLDLLRGRYGPASVLAQQSADLHRARLDYGGMAVMLALAAEAMGRAGAPAEAADLYLQAGESAAARGDTASAGPWLRQALMPGAGIATQRTAQASLARLPDVSR